MRQGPPAQIARTLVKPGVKRNGSAYAGFSIT